MNADKRRLFGGRSNVQAEHVLRLRVHLRSSAFIRGRFFRRPGVNGSPIIEDHPAYRHNFFWPAGQ
jgi:hypothetical protein